MGDSIHLFSTMRTRVMCVKGFTVWLCVWWAPERGKGSANISRYLVSAFEFRSVPLAALSDDISISSTD